MSSHLPRLVPIQQTAEYFGVDPRTVRRWISQGKLAAVRLGPRLIRVERESIEALLKPLGSY